MSDTLDLRHHVGGDRLGSTAWADSVNPSDLSDVVARAPEDDGSAVAQAVDAARQAFPAWAESSPEVRSDLLDRVGTLILERKDQLGDLLSREEGKTLAEGIGEAARAGRVFKWFAGEALRRHGFTVDSVRPGVEASTYREPVGVFGLITPWNFPIAIPAWKAAPALAFGNTVVMKPSEHTPAIAAALADLIAEAGAPAGVFNMVFGGRAAGEALVANAGVDGVSFTGSVGTGAAIAGMAVARQARLQMEMGGKNPLIVLDDADLERAVLCAVDGAFYASGQRCTASSRLIVAEGIHDRFVQALAQRAAALRVGDARDPRTQIGPVVSQAQLDKVMSYLERGGEGGRTVAGGERLTPGTDGYYLSPALVVDTAPDMRINREEIFGPVASVTRVKDYEEALAVANGTEFGLSGGIVTSSLKHANHYRRHARVGMVMVNLPTAGVDYHLPFGGTKRSSVGPREQGPAALEFYTQTKTAYVWA